LKSIRNETKKVYKMTENFDLIIKEMKKKGDFDSLEGKVIAKLFLENKPLKEADFNKAEQKVIRKLLRHPFKIISRKKGELILTENGQSTAKGYLKGLAYSRLVS